MFKFCSAELEKNGEGIVGVRGSGRLWLLSLVALSCVTASATSVFGIYPIHGTNSQYGPYEGQLEVRPGSKGQLSVNRVIHYTDFQFEKFDVEEVWAGQGRLSEGKIVTTFKIQQADIFAQVDSFQRTSEQFKNTIGLEYGANLNGQSFDFQVATGRYSENIVGAAAALSDTPIWKNERRVFPSFGRHDPVINRVAISALFAPFIAKFHNDPVEASYLAQSRCQSQLNQVIQDPTDLAFLRAHPGTIRVANKVTDQISLVEASIKRDAYAPTLAQKQDIFDREIPQHHINALGQYAVAVYDSAGQFHGFSPDYDSALYTGMYAASQAMRFLVTKDPAALLNFKMATTGLMLLMDVTGSPSDFARTLQPMPTAGLDVGWHPAVAPFANIEYLPGGNNDMIQGLFLAFSFAYEVLPPKDPFLTTVSAHAKRLPALSVNGLRGTENYMLAHGLAALASGREDELLLYASSFMFMVAPADFLSLDTGFFYGGIADWSGSNLIGVSKTTRVILAKNIVRRFSAFSSFGIAAKILREARQTLLKVWNVFDGSKRDVITVAAETFGVQGRLPGMPRGYTPYVANPKRLARSVAKTIWSLNEVPVPRSTHAIAINFMLKPDWCLSYWPRWPWKSFSENNPPSHYYQGAANYPFYELDFINTDNFGKEIFNYQNAGMNAGAHYGRVDFLYLYWMSRLGGLIAPTS